jgi:hypothetical protein
VYTPEKARALFKRSKALGQLRRLDEAETDRLHSIQLYRELVLDKDGPGKDLTDDEFDDVVVFWSK